MSAATLERAQAIVQRLDVDGIHVTLDRRRVSPPCGVLDRPSILPGGQMQPGCTRAVEWRLFLLVKGADDLIAWDRLDEMCQVVFDIWGAGIIGCEPTVFDNGDRTSFPAYEIKIQEFI